MAKSEVDAVTHETVQKGGILAKLYFDMQSEKEEDLQPLMADLISNRLLKSQGVVYCYGSIEEPIKVDNVYSADAVVTILTKDLAALVNVVFNYAPAGIELLKPEKEFVIKTAELQSTLLDISQISMSYTQYILSKVLNKEDYDKTLQILKEREALGKKLLKKENDGANKQQ